MQGLVFEPVGYFDDKLKRRDKKKRGDIQPINPKFSSKSACSTPTGPPPKHHRSSSSSFNKSCSSLLVDSSHKLTHQNMYQPTSLQTSLSHQHHSSHIHSPKSDHSTKSNHKHHKSHKSHRHHNGKSHSRKRSGSGSSTRSNHSHKSNRSSKENKTPQPQPTDDILEAYKKRLQRKKLRRTRSLNSNGATTLLNIEKERITKDKFSRLFHDFESTKSLIDKSERDQLFRTKLAKLNEKKQKNKAIAYELIRQYFDSILDKKYSNHPLALLITKFCNLFHGQYSFSPQDFKNKSIYQIVDQKRLKRKGNKRSTSDIFDDSGNHKHQSKVVRKTSRRLDKAIEDVKKYISKLRSLIIILYPELKILRTYKYVVQSVFHKELFQQLTPTLGDLYSIKTEDKQSEFAKYMGMWKNLTCRDYGVNDEFITFCLIPSIRPELLTENNNEKEGNNTTNEYKQIEEDIHHIQTEIEIAPEPEPEPAPMPELEQPEPAPVVEFEVENISGLGKQLQEHEISYGNIQEQEEEKESEIIHNAEPDFDNILTEQTLKDFDENYAITVLGGNGIDTLNNENINTNFTRPEYINPYNMELDYDDETFVDILSSGSSYRRSPNPNINDLHMRQRERELNNILNISSPSISSMDGSGVYELNDVVDIHSSPDSSLMYGSHMKTSISNNNSSTLPTIMSGKSNDITPKISVNKNKPKSRFGSILGVFSSKKKKKNISACDIKIGIYNGNINDKYDNMNTATKLIEQGIQNQRKTPQQFLTPMSNKQRRPKPLISPLKTPKISITPQNQHQENHPTPPSKRNNTKNKTNKIQLKENINNITKQMLAGSHAEKIANQLHNRHNNNDNDTDPNNSEIKSIHIESNKVIKVIEQNPKNKLDKIEEKDADEPFMESEEDRGHNPYLAAVLEIKKMPSYDTPEDKIQCVVRTADIIRDCIDKYYENRRKDPVQITPDDLLSLFAYILVQANLHCLWAEVELIDDFVVDNLRMDMPGYYIATLRAAMQLIVNDIEKLTHKSTKKRNSIIKQDNL